MKNIGINYFIFKKTIIQRHIFVKKLVFATQKKKKYIKKSVSVICKYIIITSSYQFIVLFNPKNIGTGYYYTIYYFSQMKD